MVVPVSLELRRRARLQKPNRALNRVWETNRRRERTESHCLLDLEERERQAEETGREGTAQEGKEIYQK